MSVCQRQRERQRKSERGQERKRMKKYRRELANVVEKRRGKEREGDT